VTRRARDQGNHCGAPHDPSILSSR
jgi:hypothetical protein